MKKYHLVLAVLVTALVLLGISEGVKAKNRKMALETLNQVYPTLKSDTQRVAAVVRAEPIILTNKSFFDFNTSSAWGRKAGPGSPLSSGGGFGGDVSGVGDVETNIVDYNLETGEWELLYR